MDDCVFCKIINGTLPSRKIYEDNNFYVIMDIAYVNKGHALIFTKKHSETILDTNNDGWADSGSDLPFDSSLAIPAGIHEEIQLGNEYTWDYDSGEWTDVSLLSDSDWNTGTTPSGESAYWRIYYVIPSNTINGTLAVATGLGIEEFEIPSDMVDIGGIEIRIFAYSNPEKIVIYYWNDTLDGLQEFAEIDGTSQLNQSSMTFVYGNSLPWQGSGEDWHPYTEATLSGDNGNQGATGETNNPTSGGGYAPQTYYTNAVFPTEGNNFNLRWNEKINFVVNLTNHTLTLNQFNSTTVKVTIQSAPMIVYLEKGVLKEFDLNNDSINDVRVRYDGLNGTRAMIFIQEIVYPTDNSNENNQEINNSLELNSNKNNYWILGIIIVLIIAIILFFVLHKHHRKRRYWMYGY